MEGWIAGQVAFLYTFYKVRPAVIVDKCIEIIIDVIVPGRGVGESHWIMRGWRSLEQSAERKARELEIRADLRNWDEQYPQFHHELIVRYLTGFVASAVVSSLVHGIKGLLFSGSGGRRDRRY
eukprot:CAMPEP_0116573602 /NCGR_PEP_ID=MMETSP0397-20121206/18883_1 /TAXON_ID=216820 /ORGANISM="Cyclophora tenuis, Strain ECT3854" /LENGTH=122 /DNA_ID=CAMNT_0004102181 /DNA_START=43 /DNA_END=411 /DNA_ORIENTATION=-